MDKAVVEIKIVDKLDLPVGEFAAVSGTRREGNAAKRFDSLSRREIRGNVAGISGGANGVPH